MIYFAKSQSVLVIISPFSTVCKCCTRTSWSISVGIDLWPLPFCLSFALSLPRNLGFVKLNSYEVEFWVTLVSGFSI